MSLISTNRGVRSILSLLLVGACGDATNPSLEGADVRIYLGESRYDEQTIALGSSIVLDGRLYDATGKRVDGHSVEWSSDDPAIASVSQAGVVTGNAIGTTKVIARHTVGEDTALVNVAQPLSGTPSCDSGVRTFTVGTPQIFSGTEATAVCLPGGEYSLVVVNTGTTAGASLQTQVTASGVRSPFGAPSPYLAPEPTSARLTQNEAFHQWMRAEMSALLEPRLRAGVDALQPTGPRLQASVGQLMHFNVESGNTQVGSNGCSEEHIDRRAARVRHIGQRAIIVEDTLNPANGLTLADYQEFGNQFDNDIWPVLTSNFGEPTDIDNNGKVIILFTMAVNQRRENSIAGSFVGGFFFNRDLFSTTGRSACKGSNSAEMFYMRVPDPDGIIRGKDAFGEYQARPVTVASVKKTTPSIIAHEFQHLINDSRRLHITKSLVWEETWLNEGLSHIAEELMFFEQSGLQPGQNFTASTFQNDPNASAAFEKYQLANLDRLAYMLRQPTQSSLMGEDDLETRGATWFFLRYMADRRGGDETSLWRGLVRDVNTSGLANLQRVLGEDPRGWIADWAAAVYLDDVSGLTLPPRYQISSWNFRNIYPEAGTLWPGSFYQNYPLNVLAISNANSPTYSLQGGAPLYLRTGVSGSGMGAIRFTVTSLPPPSRLKVVVTRLR